MRGKRPWPGEWWQRRLAKPHLPRGASRIRRGGSVNRPASIFHERTLMILALSLLAANLDTNPIGHRHLVFNQDFSRMKHIDSKSWHWNDGPVYNHEQEKYTNQKVGNAYLQNRCLVIEARREGSTITSARLESTQTWKYGYFEIRAKVPPGRGTWPAIWLLNQHIRDKAPAFIGWPKCGEIDIMENVGVDPSLFHFSLHSEDYNFHQKNQRTKIVTSGSPQDFHTFGLDWEPSKIVFYLDGKPSYEVDKTIDTFNDWPFRDRFFMILNLAIGGDWGGYKGVDMSIFPAKFEISYIRIYQ